MSVSSKLHMSHTYTFRIQVVELVTRMLALAIVMWPGNQKLSRAFMMAPALTGIFVPQ